MSAPAVAVSADGKKFAAAWMDKRVGRPNVYWAVSDGPRFSEDSFVHDLDGEQNHPAIAIDPSGTVWVAWEDRRSGRQSIWARSSAENDAERQVSDSRQDTASFPAIACSAGLVAMVYEVGEDGHRAVVFRRLESAR